MTWSSQRAALLPAIALVVLPGLAGCPKSVAVPNAADSGIASVASASIATDSGAPALAAPSASAPNMRAHSVERVTRAWNAATNAHDADRLGELYADEVELYGTRMTRARAVAAKKIAFAKHLRDDLTDLTVTKEGRAVFNKTTTAKDGKTSTVLGYLETSPDDAAKITVEGDTTTDKNRERAFATTCESAVSAVALSTAEGKAAQAQITEGAKHMPKDDPVNLSGMVMPPDAKGGTWYVGICENHVDRMPCFHHFTVDPETGGVTYSGLLTSSLDPKPLKTDPALAAAVRAACK